MRALFEHVYAHLRKLRLAYSYKSFLPLTVGIYSPVNPKVLKKASHKKKIFLILGLLIFKTISQRLVSPHLCHKILLLELLDGLEFSPFTMRSSCLNRKD